MPSQKSFSLIVGGSGESVRTKPEARTFGGNADWLEVDMEVEVDVEAEVDVEGAVSQADKGRDCSVFDD